MIGKIYQNNKNKNIINNQHYNIKNNKLQNNKDKLEYNNINKNLIFFLINLNNKNKKFLKNMG
jgi:hypothetical protein